LVAGNEARSATCYHPIDAKKAREGPAPLFHTSLPPGSEGSGGRCVRLEWVILFALLLALVAMVIIAVKL
jgi:hypothetical protein